VVVLVVVVVSLSALGPPTAAAGDGPFAGSTTPTEQPLAQDDFVREGDADATLEDGSTYYRGQVLYRDGLRPDTRYEVTGNDGPVELVFTDDDGELLVDTGEDGFGVGTYRLRLAGEGRVATFQLVRQSIMVELDPETVDGADAELTVDVRSNRRSYPLRVTATRDGDEVDPEDLRAVLGRGETVDDDDRYVELAGENRFSFEADFEDADTGVYRFTFSVADTTADTTVEVDVASDPGGRVRFVGGTSDHRGDVVVIPLEFEDTERATLAIGGEEVNYLLVATVVDRDEDGEMVVEWNTDRAGQADPDDVVSAADDDVVRDERRRIGGFSAPDRRLAVGSYRTNITVGARETDSETVVLLDPGRVERSVTVLRAPEGASPSEAVDTATPTGSVTGGDYVVVRVQAAGLTGYLDDVDALRDELQGVSVSIRETESSVPNAARRPVDLGDFRFESVPEEDAFYLTARTDRTDLEPNRVYEVTFEMDADENPYVDEDIERSTTFEVIERSATVATGRGNPVRVQPDVERITGRTTLSPGSEVFVLVQETTGDPLRRTATATVEADGRFGVEVDLSGLSVGRDLTIAVEFRGERIGRTSGVVVEPATVELGDQETRNPLIVTVDRVSAPDGGFVVLTRPDDRTVLGVERLPTGVSEAVDVILESPLAVGTTRLRATLYRDTGPEGFDTEEDLPYRAGGDPVSTAADVTLLTGTTTTPPATTTGATATTTATTGATATGTTTTERTEPTSVPPTEPSDDTDPMPTPGFGSTGVLVAFALTAVVAAARRDR
jgi:hypothetical protein